MALLAGAAAAAAGATLNWYLRGKRPLQWELVASLPESRSQHAAAVRDGCLYIVGGCCDERWLNDVLVLDLKTLNWSQAEPCPLSCAGHSLIATENDFIVIVGIPSENKVLVYKLVESSWSLVSTTGDAPVARRGHSGTLIDKTVWVFGGEDFCGNLLNDMHILDLETKNWKRVHASGSIPPAVAFHGVASRDKHLYLFGGQTGLDLCKDLFVFDCDHSKWSVYSQKGSPRVQFGVVTVGSYCYTVGGGVQETAILDMKSMEWYVVSVEPRLARVGFSLIEAEGGSLIASGPDGAKQFGVFMSKPCRKLQTAAGASTCEVKGSDGSFTEFAVPQSGKPAADIHEALAKQTGHQGCLKRQRLTLTARDLVLPGEQLTFHWSPMLGKLSVSLMDTTACRSFLAQMGISVTRGVGWLHPTKELEADAFVWESWPNRQDMLNYLRQYADLLTRKVAYRVNDRGTVSKVSSSGPTLVYELEFELQVWLEVLFMDAPLVSFWLEKQVQEDSKWKALVMLLALNIKSPGSKPWMVISDLNDDWEFAWMDGPSIYTSKARSRKEGLGILRDLVRDCDKVTREEVAGTLSKLPSVFSRRSVDLPCDAPSQKPFLFQKRKVEGGLEFSIMGTDFKDVMLDEDCWSYPDESLPSDGQSQSVILC